MKKYDIIKYVGKEEMFSPKSGEIGIIKDCVQEPPLFSIEWKNKGVCKKTAWFKSNEIELIKSFEWVE